MNRFNLKLRLGITLFLSLFCLTSFSQSTTDIWPQYYISMPIKGKLGLSADFSHRYNGFFEKKTQLIGRVGLNYKLNKGVSIAAGYAYSEYYTSVGKRIENRPWQQISFAQAFTKVSFAQRLRLEERFQKDALSERFNYRLRFQAQVSLPLLKENKLSVVLSDEPMINFGNEIKGNKFDQNRLQVGLQIKLIKNVFLAPAFVRINQYQANKKQYIHYNVIRTGLTYSR